MLRSVWRLLSPLIPSGGPKVVSIALLSLLSATAEAVVLVATVNVALLVAGGSDHLDLELPVVGSTGIAPSTTLAVAAIAALVSLVGHVLVARLTARVAADTIRTARTRATRAYASASWDRQARDREGALQQTTTLLAQQSAALSYQLAQLIASVVALMALFTAAVLVDPTATIAVVAFGAVIFGLLSPITRATKRRARRFVQVSSSFAEEVTAWTRMAMDLRVFGVEGAELRRLDDLNRQAARRFFEARFANRLGSALYRDIAQVCLVAGVAALYVLDDVDLRSTGAVVLLALRALGYATQAQGSLQDVTEQAPNLELLVERTESLEAEVEAWGSVTVDDVVPLELVDVGYAYDGERDAVTSLSLTLRPGEVLGVIGPSGGGKSTLVQLLLRLRVPTSGRVVAGGLPYEEIDPACWQRQVSLVAQTPLLFEGTISDNIRFHREGIGEDAVRAAARDAHVLDDIERLPAGFETRLGPRGSGLSGGQQQRVSIARALAGAPRLLVLDEPTSALDVRSEGLIQETLAGLKGTVTLVIVAHRLSTLQSCDRVLVLDDGRVRFVGPLDEALEVADFQAGVAQLVDLPDATAEDDPA